jgi:cation transport ATPase
MNPQAADQTNCAFCGLPLSRPWWQQSAASSAPIAQSPEEFCCVGCQFAAEVQRERRTGAVLNWPLARLGLAIFLTMNVSMFTMALWTDSVYSPGANPVPGDALAQPLADMYRYLSLMLSLPVLWLLGGPLARSAWQNLWRGSGAADLLLLMGVVASFVYSTVSVLRGQGHLYFEVGCVVLVTVTLGRWLESMGRLQASAAMDELGKLLPDQVQRVVFAPGSQGPAPARMRWPLA